MIKATLFGIGIVIFALAVFALLRVSGGIFYPRPDYATPIVGGHSVHEDIQAAVLRSSEYEDTHAQTIVARPAVIGVPTQILIPRIRVDATLEQVGITPLGHVDTPKGPASPAWYKLGPRPGVVGSAVIVGHYGWKNNIPAVFDHLALLQAGDQIIIRDASGGSATFVVRELRTYGAHDSATEVFLSNDGKAHLNLITCSGVWNKTNKSYSSRLVVFTDRVTE